MQLHALIAAADASVDFVGQLDCDEYVYLHGPLSLPLYLSQVDPQVGSISFQWVIQPGGATYPAVTDIHLGLIDRHVKSFHRPNGVNTIMHMDPHCKQILPEFRQELAGNHHVMSTARNATKVKIYPKLNWYGGGGPSKADKHVMKMAKRHLERYGPQGNYTTPWVLPEHFVDPAVHPFILHFRARTLSDYIRKVYRGTGGKFREEDDFLSLEDAVVKWSHFSGSDYIKHAPLSEAFVSMVRGLIKVLGVESSVGRGVEDRGQRTESRQQTAEGRGQSRGGS